MLDHQFWAGKRVLVTGHTGFKGGWLCLWLKGLGAQVTGYSLPPSTSPNLYEIACVGESMQDVTGDIRDLDHVCRVVENFRPEIVFHMAAQPLVRQSYANPVETYATNVMGTVHLLEAVRRVRDVRACVNVTSDKCYENREWVWGYRENEPMGGYDPYSSSKGCAELVTAAYRTSFFNSPAATDSMSLASVRAGNVVGGGDWAEDRLIPDMVRAFMGGKPAVIRNPDAIRPWQHVLEPLSGYLVLAQRLWSEGSSYAEAWNFGSDEHDAKPVRWVANKLAAMWGDGAGWKVDEKRQPHEAHYLKLDSSKAKERLGWRRILKLEQALRLTVEWYQAHAQGGDLQAITGRQIGDYTKLINGSAA